MSGVDRMRAEAVRHCLEKIAEIADRGAESRRDLLQLGYNLGRLSELTELGREPFWDDWKTPVADGDAEELRRRSERLRERLLPFLVDDAAEEPSR